MLAQYGINASEEELYYIMYYKTRAEGAEKLSYTLTRPDTITYQDFLSIVSPFDSQIKIKKFGDISGPYSGKERILPSYIFNKLIDVFRTEISFYRVQQSLKTKMITAHGDLANRTFHLIAGEDESIQFEELEAFLAANNQILRPDEFTALCRISDFDDNHCIEKTEFLDILTPFEPSLVSNVGIKSFEHLLEPQNQPELSRYIGNEFPLSKRPQREKLELSELDKEVFKQFPNYTSSIFTKALNRPDHPLNKNTWVSEDMKWHYDLSKKAVNPSSMRGFNHYYDPYFKTLCHQERHRATKIAKKKVEDRLNLLHNLKTPNYAHALQNMQTSDKFEADPLLKF